MKDRGLRLLQGAVLLLGALALGGCEKVDADSPAAAAAAQPAAPTQEEFQQSLEGLWSTDVSQGDDAETLYAIEWLPDAGLRVVRDGNWLDGQVEDIDLDNGTLALHVTSPTGPSETVTVRKLASEKDGGGFTLLVTWGAGQTDALGFVRRLTDRDRSRIADAIAAARQEPEQACETDAPAGSVRAALVCDQEEFAEMDANLRGQFAELAKYYPDGDRTVAAATRQLDACATPACLREAYAKWQAYLDENYPLGMAE